MASWELGARTLFGYHTANLVEAAATLSTEVHLHSTTEETTEAIRQFIAGARSLTDQRPTCIVGGQIESSLGGRIQPVIARSSASRSDGFMKPRRLRGRSLRLRAITSSSASLSTN